MAEKLVRRQPHIFDDLTQEDRRDVAATMDRNRCATTIGMCELLMGAALPDLSEAQSHKDRDDFARLKNPKPRHLGGDRFDTYEFALQLGFAILQEHFDDFTEVLGQLLLSLSLGMSTGKPWDVADEKSRLGIALNYSCEFSHYPTFSGSETNDTPART